MKNFLAIVTVLFITTLSTKQLTAQANKLHTASINFGPEVFVPENFSPTHKVGGGLSFKTEYTFGKHASTTFNTGITFMKGKRKFDNFTSPVDNFYKDIVAIPLKLGGRYYIGNFYFLGEVGAIVMTNYSSGTKAVFSAGLGDKINIGRQKFDVSARQEIWIGRNNEQYTMAVLRVAYELTFR